MKDLPVIPARPVPAGAKDIERLGERLGGLMLGQGDAIIEAFVEHGRISARQTRWIIGLTAAIVVLTFALVVLAVSDDHG